MPVVLASGDANLNKETASKRKIKLEASGSITLQNVKAIAKTGVDRISVGGVTHSARHIDVSLEIVN